MKLLVNYCCEAILSRIVESITMCALLYLTIIPIFMEEQIRGCKFAYIELRILNKERALPVTEPFKVPSDGL